MTKNNLAPIALFTYKRLSHTKKTVDALRENKHAPQSIIYIFSDGTKNEDDKKKVLAVREYLTDVKNKQYFKNTIIIEAKKNKGLAQSIIDGVTQIIKKHGKIIVLEDDIVTNRYFLDYMNEALDIYEDEEKIFSIHSYNYPITNSPDYFFTKGPGTRVWGWATWARSWALFEKNGKKLAAALKEKNKIKEFNFNNSYNYYGMLKNQILGLNNSWAIRWHASGFLNDKLTLYPGRSLVQNIGFGADATHTIHSENIFFHHDFDAIAPLPILKKIPMVENKLVKGEKINFFFRTQAFPVKNITDLRGRLIRLYMTKLPFLHKPWRAFKKTIGMDKNKK